MIVELFDGTRLEFPEGTSPDIVQKTAKRMTAERQSATRKEAGKMALEGTSMGERALIGAGKTVSNLIGGAKQLMGGGASADEVRETKDRDSALNSGAALVGQIAGYVPTMFIPGANTYGGAAAVGAGIGALQEAEDPTDRLKNTAISAGASVAGKAIGDKLAQALRSKLAAKTAEAVTQQGQNAVKDATLSASREAGYVVPPSAVNQSAVGRRLESIAGKAAIGQEASVRNQRTTNALARKALGMADDAQLDEAALSALRKTEGKAYEAVASLNKDAADALEALKQARFDANAQRKFYERSANPAALKASKEAASEAAGWEKFLEQEAQNAGKPELVDALRKARTTIAKTHDVERAMNDATGDVSARKLAQMLNAGKPLSGELETAGRFGQAFERYAQEGSKVPTPGVSKSEALASALLGTVGGAAAGPVGTLAAALPLLSGPARSFLLSKAGQKLLAQAPEYAAPKGTKLAAALMANPQLRAALPGLSAGAAPLLVNALQ